MKIGKEIKNIRRCQRMTNELLNLVKEINKKYVKGEIDNTTRMVKLMEEVGELSQMILLFEKSNNMSNSMKNNNIDVVKETTEEIIDSFIVLMDMIVSINPDITEEEINEIIKRKTNKWKNKFKN